MGRHDNAGTDLAAGLEPVPITARLEGTELESLIREFHTYTLDSVLPDGTSLSDKPFPINWGKEVKDKKKGKDGKGDSGDEEGEEDEEDDEDDEDDEGDEDDEDDEGDEDDEDDEGEGDETSSSSEEDEHGDVWVCSCRPSRGSGWTCSRADGKTCDCVGQFGNFYKYLDTDDESDEAESSTKPIDRLQILDLDGLPERLPLRGVRWPVSVQRGMSGMGLALVYRGAGMPLPKGAFISLYAGECLTTAQARARWSHPDARPRGQGNYTLTIRSPDEVLHVDPRHVGNVGRFLNHSCDPNCVIHLVRWGGGRVWPRAAIFTRRMILPGEELTFDYSNASGQVVAERGLLRHGDSSVGVGRTRCLCGTKKCRKWMPFDETL